MTSPKPYREKRPWGEFVEFTKNEASTVKIITVKAGQALSLQHHQNRDEFWHVMSGEGTITIGDQKVPVLPNSDHFVPRETNHRIEAGTKDITILEIAFGNFDENDIVRVEDRYNRK